MLQIVCLCDLREITNVSNQYSTHKSRMVYPMYCPIAKIERLRFERCNKCFKSILNSQSLLGVYNVSPNCQNREIAIWTGQQEFQINTQFTYPTWCIQYIIQLPKSRDFTRREATERKVEGGGVEKQWEEAGDDSGEGKGGGESTERREDIFTPPIDWRIRLEQSNGGAQSGPRWEFGTRKRSSRTLI